MSPPLHGDVGTQTNVCLVDQVINSPILGNQNSHSHHCTPCILHALQAPVIQRIVDVYSLSTGASTRQASRIKINNRTCCRIVNTINNIRCMPSTERQDSSVARGIWDPTCVVSNVLHPTPVMPLRQQVVPTFQNFVRKGVAGPFEGPLNHLNFIERHSRD